MRRAFLLKYLILVFLVLVGVITKTKNTNSMPESLDSLHSNYISHVLQGANKSPNFK